MLFFSEKSLREDVVLATEVPSTNKPINSATACLKFTIETPLKKERAVINYHGSLRFVAVVGVLTLDHTNVRSGDISIEGRTLRVMLRFSRELRRNPIEPSAPHSVIGNILQIFARHCTI